MHKNQIALLNEWKKTINIWLVGVADAPPPSNSGYGVTSVRRSIFLWDLENSNKLPPIKGYLWLQREKKW